MCKPKVEVRYTGHQRVLKMLTAGGGGGIQRSNPTETNQRRQVYTRYSPFDEIV